MDPNSIIQANQLPTQLQSQTKIMGKDDFLKLMLMQMKHQDPLNPMDNQAMLSQMAQFSSLEQLSNLNETTAQNGSIASNMEATRLLGKEVDILDPSSTPDEQKILTTKVKEVSFTGDGPVLTLSNGMVTTVDGLLKVAEPQSN